MRMHRKTYSLYCEQIFVEMDEELSQVKKTLRYAFRIFSAHCPDLKFEISYFQSADRAHEIPGIRMRKFVEENKRLQAMTEKLKIEVQMNDRPKTDGGIVQMLMARIAELEGQLESLMRREARTRRSGQPNSGGGAHQPAAGGQSRCDQ